MVDSNVLITIVCRKDKKNQQNQAPLYLRIIHNKRRKLIYLKEKIDVNFWNFEANQIKSEYPNKEYLEIAINENRQYIGKKVLSLKLANKPFSIDDICSLIPVRLNKVYVENVLVCYSTHDNRINEFKETIVSVICIGIGRVFH